MFHRCGWRLALLLCFSAGVSASHSCSHSDVLLNRLMSVHCSSPTHFANKWFVGAFVQKNTGQRLLFREKTACVFPFTTACLVLLAWSCPLACFISYVASVSSIACTHIISLIKAWCLYHSGTPALLHNAFPIGERRPE